MKLTNKIRESVIDQIRRKTYMVEVKAFEDALAPKIDEILLARGEILASEIPEKFVNYIQTFQEVHIYHSVGYDLMLVRAKNVFCRHGYNSDRLTSDEIVNQKNAIKDSWEQKKATLEAVLNSCTTTKQLLLTLPEFANYIPEDAPVFGSLVAVETVSKAKEILAGIRK